MQPSLRSPAVMLAKLSHRGLLSAARGRPSSPTISALFRPLCTAAPQPELTAEEREEQVNVEEGLDGRYGEWVREFNMATRTHPTALLAAMMGTEMAMLGSVYTVLSLAESVIPGDLAVAYMLNRIVKRVRMPADLAVTAGLSWAFPTYTRARLSRVLSKPFAQLALARADRSSLSSSPDAAPAARSTFMGIDAQGNVQNKWLKPVAGVMDRYGVLYAAGARLCGVASTLTLYALLRNGLDVQSVLDTMGAPELGNTAGSFAATVLLTSAIYFPACVLTAPRVAGMLAQAAPGVFGADTNPPPHTPRGPDAGSPGLPAPPKHEG